MDRVRRKAKSVLKTIPDQAAEPRAAYADGSAAKKATMPLPPPSRHMSLENKGKSPAGMRPIMIGQMASPENAIRREKEFMDSKSKTNQIAEIRLM